jgi:glutathione S-transferase
MDGSVVTGFAWAPPFAQGLIRDLRVRWALAEAGLPYAVELIRIEDRKSSVYRRWHPFGMVPAFAMGGNKLFESGAIVHLVAEKSEALLPADPAERAETIVWMYAALNTVEPPVIDLFAIDVTSSDQEWAKLRRPAATETVGDRLAVLAERLAERNYLLGRFTAADILMATVLRFLRDSEVLPEYPIVAAYLQRCEARPAFRRALDEQLAEFAANEPVPA